MGNRKASVMIFEKLQENQHFFFYKSCTAWPFKSHDFLQIENMRIAVTYAFKRPSHGPMQTPMRCFYRSRDSLLNKLSNNS